jgi:hypothetical protein
LIVTQPGAGSGGTPFVTMMEPAHLRDRYDPARPLVLAPGVILVCPSAIPDVCDSDFNTSVYVADLEANGCASSTRSISLISTIPRTAQRHGHTKPEKHLILAQFTNSPWTGRGPRMQDFHTQIFTLDYVLERSFHPCGQTLVLYIVSVILGRRDRIGHFLLGMARRLILGGRHHRKGPAYEPCDAGFRAR